MCYNEENLLSEIVVQKIINKLSECYPEAKCELLYSNPFELLIATILSAQTTDKKVNQVTQKLFGKCKTPKDFLKLSQEELTNEIKQLGLSKVKSNNILKTCELLVEKYQSQVPENRDDLELLPGVGRKTAGVVLSNVFSTPAIAVDTHVFRVANRIGLANSNKVLETEQQLMDKIPITLWTKAHHLLIWHGRQICQARKPMCEACVLQSECQYLKS